MRDSEIGIPSLHVLVAARMLVHQVSREVGSGNEAFRPLVEAKRVLGGLIIAYHGDEAWAMVEDLTDSQRKSPGEMSQTSARP